MPADTAAERLQRILYILPAAAREEGVDISELAAALDVDTTTVMRDIEHVTERAFYQPAGAVEEFTMLFDGRRVEVHAPHEFRRPVRLNQHETLALGLGLRCLAAESEVDRRTEILRLAARLEQTLRAPDTPTIHEMHALPYADVLPLRARAERAARQADDVDYEEFVMAFDDDGFRGVIADAVELRRTCTIWYLKPGDVAPAYRSIAPYRLVYADGMWYVAAYDLDREGLRFFRMDRVLNATLEEEPSPEVPQHALDALLASGAPYSASDDVEVEVRYSPRVARWVAERTAAQLERDGSITLRHRVADSRWLVRHVLQYGGDAVVIEPEAARHWVAAAAADVLEAQVSR